jgi:hypothetical protein
MDHNRHDFTGGKLPRSVALALPIGALELLPLRQKVLAEFIDMTKQFE